MNARLLIDPPAPGAWNMAVDEALLLDAAENGVATLRLYGWSEPTLSLGYFQRYADRETHIASRACAVVRRQTGGGAILHDRELTYSLVLPETHPFAKHSQRLYATVHRVMIDALDLVPSTSPTESNQQLQIRESGTDLRASEEPFLCFQRKSPGDVIVGAANAQQPPWKILGSAQRRYRRAVLQHGSLLIERSPAAPELPGLTDLTHTSVATNELIQSVVSRLETALKMRFVRTQLSPELESKATELANNKYGSAGWTNRR
jgi:lipoyl(octanoyl) transferase